MEEGGIGFGGEWDGGGEDRVVAEMAEGGMRGMVEWW